MSKLSSKCDELLDRAHELRMFADGLSAPYIVPSTKETIGLSMQSAATELERAADTIRDLHCKCSDLMGEREELSRRLEHATEMNSMLIGMSEHDRMQIASMLTSIDGINLSERIRELEDENTRLRSCLSDDAENARLLELLCELYEDQCDECDRWKYRDRMHELGVEVEE